MNRKQLLINSAIEYLKAEILKSQSIRDFEHDALKDSPSAMQSWSDTTRSQKEDLMLGMDQQLANKKKMLHVLESLSVEDHSTIQLGSLVKLADNEQSKYYFILPGIIGEPIDIGGIHVDIISPTSVVARALMGCKINESVKVEIPSGISILHIDEIE